MKRLHYTYVRAAFSLRLILLLVAFNIPIIGQQPLNPAGQIATPPPDKDSILLAVTVTDKKGNHVGGLDKSAFTIYEDKVSQEISFFAAKDETASIGIIFDLSGSMVGGKRLTDARNAVLRFMELSNSADEYFVVAFSGRPRLVIDWTRGGKAVAEEFSKYDFTARSGKGALYDACYLSIEKMRSGAHHKQAILLITDGQDSDSRQTFKDVKERLKETSVILYSIGVFGASDFGSSLGMEGQSVLKDFSETSGGLAFFPENKKKVDEIFDRIALELRHQYLIGFKPSQDNADGKWHKIKIKVTPPPTATGSTQSLHTRSREGYYAAKNLR